MSPHSEQLDIEETYVPYDYQDDPSNTSWAGALPKKQALYDPQFEKDACGVGFSCHIKGKVSHKIVSDAADLLCNMTHRGATGSDARDGDGAGVMTSIPHRFMRREFERDNDIVLPPLGQYAVGNLFFKNEPTVLANSKATVERIASSLNLRVLAWREVPRDSSLLGPAALSREPSIWQPIIVLEEAYGDGNRPNPDNIEDFGARFDRYFERQLYVLRKQATHSIGLHNWFYICSLSNKNLVYKGQLAPRQVYSYYYDLMNVNYEAHFALVHSRFSTNTFPSWDRAQPLRWAAHNGEINTLRGNKNWMRAREGQMESAAFGDELDLLYPIIEEGGSDSAAFDNVLELLVINGVLSLPEAVMMMVPEAWQNNPDMDPKKRAFYEWAACLMEPWDGPALFTFSDGRYCGAQLDRNGLRPCRYYVTNDDRMICASEVGVIPIDPEIIIQKGRLRPGRMLLVDTKEGRIVDDRELKHKVGDKADFKSWLHSNMVSVHDLYKKIDKAKKFDELRPVLGKGNVQSDPRMIAFGYTLEQVSMLLAPMAIDGKEALGSMGNDTGLACMTLQPKVIYDYFRQLFAQVTNPPIDPIREAIVMSLECYIGPQGNILEMKPDQCDRFHLPSPILSIEELNAIKQLPKYYPKWAVDTLDITFDKSEGVAGYTKVLDRICQEASESIAKDHKIIVLSDRATSKDRIPVSALVATATVHHYLVKQKERSRVALIVDTAEAREVHHMCVLVGYGADAICPYLILEALLKLNRDHLLAKKLSDKEVVDNYRSAADNGILKVMSKMGISTLASYKGAQIFEILGIDNSVVDRCFVGTPSRIHGVGFDYIAQDAITMHDRAWPSRDIVDPVTLPETGEYNWRDGGDPHVNEPAAISNLQDAVRNKNEKAYDTYAKKEHEAIKHCTLRGMLDFDYDNSHEIPIDQVEPWTEIVRRFVTGAMSYGSISMESHSTLAVAMNRLGGKSNTGEGGEDPERSIVNESGDTMRSSIKQIASGRFGVTSVYLSDSDELQIKMAQGAKPGEGGELPGHKVTQSIAKTRHSTPGVGLISPPPHHDIYSIEDLKQLIYDLKCANPRARVSVKLVSEVGVGIIASGVAKARADHILIAGHDGGTGASRFTGIKYAGLPWELGLAETHQTLVLNDLRGRVTVQTDGQLRTGRDVAIACLLGAEEWGFATAPLIAMGCIYMRKCHLNTCPVGIATQDPELRKKFTGTPEHVINFFYYVAQELRGIMAKLGFRTVNEMVGRAEKLKVDNSFRNVKSANLDLTPILTPAHTLRPGVATYKTRQQDHRLHIRLDNKLIDEAEITLEKGLPVQINCEIINTDRAFGTTLSYRISKRFGEDGLPDDTVHVDVVGSAGQSFGAFLAPGVTLELEGDANDYVGKGLSGGRIVVYPPQNSPFISEENIIIGNTCLYGATSGKCFFRGIAAERFAVRNSGATAVVEGVGDHGCEYMTGGRVVVLGATGRNFAAGMSGGIAYVLDVGQEFTKNVNHEMVGLTQLEDPSEIAFVRGLIEEHRHYTGSTLAGRVLSDFNRILPLFVKVLPHDYKRVLDEDARKLAEAKLSEIDTYLHNYKEDPTADATNGEVKRMKKKSTTFRLDSSHSTIAEEVDKLKKKSHHHEEAKVADVEDTILDIEAEKAKDPAKAVLKLDKVRGFMKYKRRSEKYRHAKTRIDDWSELNERLTPDNVKYQAARCMDCGVPFCQSETGCPISNIIPKWNELVFKDRWYDALQRLLMTNNFPEFTGRVCPAPCEGACVLGINEDPVGIKSIECAIIDHGFEKGWIKPHVPEKRTGKTVAIVGSGPAGLACAEQLNRAGHRVTVYEREDRAGGLLMYGIPNMKLDKRIVQRRVDLMIRSGIDFVLDTAVGSDVSMDSLQSSYDAVVVAIGSTIPRDLKIPGRDLKGIKYAMELLKWNTQSLLSENLDEVLAEIKDKDVLVIGGGDTGNDCLGTSVRHKAKSVTNFELLPRPAEKRTRDNPWPQWPRVFRVDYGHTEVSTHYGKDPREYSIMSKEFVGDDEGHVKGVKTVRIEWTQSDTGAWKQAEVPGSEEFFPADLVLLSMGFLGPEATHFGLPTDARGNFEAPATTYHVEGNVFAAGDCRRGQSLIVWGIQEGRQCARNVDTWLMGSSQLPGNGGIETRNLKPLEKIQATVA